MPIIFTTQEIGFLGVSTTVCQYFSFRNAKAHHQAKDKCTEGAEGTFSIF